MVDGRPQTTVATGFPACQEHTEDNRRTVFPACQEQTVHETGNRTLCLSSLRAKRSNLLTNKEIASPPAAARNDKDGEGRGVTFDRQLPEGKIHYRGSQWQGWV